MAGRISAFGNILVADTIRGQLNFRRKKRSRSCEEEKAQRGSSEKSLFGVLCFACGVINRNFSLLCSRAWGGKLVLMRCDDAPRCPTRSVVCNRLGASAGRHSYWHHLNAKRKFDLFREIMLKTRARCQLTLET
jgi:hypothetical protein